MDSSHLGQGHSDGRQAADPGLPPAALIIITDNNAAAATATTTTTTTTTNDDRPFFAGSQCQDLPRDRFAILPSHCIFNTFV